MSNLTFFKLDDLGPARDGVPLPERLIAGDPRFKSWDVEKSSDERVRAGVWRCTETTRKIWVVYA